MINKFNYWIKYYFQQITDSIMKLLENKVAIVTGGSRGIGEAIVLKLAENGANIAFTYVSSDEKAKALEEKIKTMA